MAIAPLHIYQGNLNGTGQWSVNPFYTQGPNGQNFNEQQAYDRYKLARDTDSGTSGGTDPNDKMFSFLDKAADKNFGYQKGLMEQTNFYRTKEGATQGQMDEQAHRRLSTQIASQQYMQNRAGDITEQAKQNDRRRALSGFKGAF